MNNGTLTAEERDTLTKLETLIERHLQSWEQAAKALAAIRDRKLYRDAAKTFAEYVETRWGISASRAYQLMQSAAVVENVNQKLTENQARRLAALPAEQQAAALAEAGGPTATLYEIEGTVARKKRGARRPSRRRRVLKLCGKNWSLQLKHTIEQDPAAAISDALSQLASKRAAA